MQKKHIVRLSEEERQQLTEVIKKLQGGGQKVRRAYVLLQADANGPNWTDAKIAGAYHCRTKTVENIRRRFVEGGPGRALETKQRGQPPTPKLSGGGQEAQIIATRLGSPPAGYANWSLRLLAAHVMELGVAGSVSHETARKLIKKTAWPSGRLPIGSSRLNRMLNLWHQWRKCWRFMGDLMIRHIR